MQKINIVKIWSDSMNKENLKKILIDAKKWSVQTWEKFVFISSGAVKLWKDKVESLWNNFNNFTKASLSSIWQKYLMRLYWDLLWNYEIVSEILIDDYANEKHLANTLSNLIENNVWVIVNHNDALHKIEIDNITNKSDNDKNTIFLSKILFKNLKWFTIEKVIYLTNTDWLLDENKKTVLWWKIYCDADKKHYIKYVKKSKNKIGTWWMISKLDCSFSVLDFWVKKSIIANAKNGLSCLIWWDNFTSFF